MKYKVYNENGIVTVTRVLSNGNEVLMFKVSEGEVATLEVVAHLHSGENTKIHKIKN